MESFYRLAQKLFSISIENLFLFGKSNFLWNKFLAIITYKKLHLTIPLLSNLGLTHIF